MHLSTLERPTGRRVGPSYWHLAPWAGAIFVIAALLGRPLAAAAQDLTNTGTTLLVQPGATLYVGTGGLSNQAGATLTNAGTLRTDGPLLNAGTLDLGAGALEVRSDLTNAGTLLPGTSPVTFSGLADQLLTPGGASLYQVLVNKPTAGTNTLRLAGDLTVSNLLELDAGFVSTQRGPSTYTLHLPNGATLSNEGPSRYVVGTVEVTRNGVSGRVVDFGLGAVLDPATNNLGTVVITRRAGLLTPDVSFGQNFAPNAPVGIDCIWTVAPATQPSAAVQLTLSWLPDNDHGLSNFSHLAQWQQAAAGQPWAAVGGAAGASGRSLRMAPTVLNRFTISTAPAPLPVTLTTFTAQAAGLAAARLRWTTASELDNAGFTVERSLDGRAFVAIGTVAGAGTSTTRHDYTLLDDHLPAGASLLYYRLAQTDLSGAVTYTPVRIVALAAAGPSFVVYPSHVPVGQTISYLYTGPAGVATVEVLDLLGRVVRSTPVAGGPQGEVTLAGLAPGPYLVHYAAAAASITTRCVVQ